MTPRQAATVFFGTIFFGLLTFISGLFIGAGIAQPTLSAALLAKPRTVTVAPLPSAAPSSPAPAAAPANSGVRMSEDATAVHVPIPPAPPKSAADLPVASAAAPEPVKEFRVGLPPTLGSTSRSRVRAIEAAQRDGKTATPVAADAPPFVFSVQVGSFFVQKNAERLAEELAKRGYHPRILTAQNPGEPAWYPVVLSPVNDVGMAEHLAEMFNANEGRRTELVSWLLEKK